MKILHLIDTLGIGGAEVLLINYIKEYKRIHPESKHYIISLKKSKDRQLSEEAKHLGTYVNMDVNKSNFLTKGIAFRSYLFKEKIDIIHTHLLDSMLFARITKPAKVKLVSTYHNTYYNKSNVFFSWWRMQLDRMTYCKQYYSIFVSKPVAETIKAAVPVGKKHIVLANFAGKEFKHCYKFNPANRLSLISIGNLKPSKNHELAILALAELKSYPIELHIYGEGELHEQLENLIKKLGANVCLKGKEIITSELLSGYDAFLMTSLNEGMPVSLIEAISTGLPSILNNLPMMHETAKTAAIYYKTNSKEDLKNVLKGVLKDKKVLQKVANESIKVSKSYSAEVYVDALHSIYSQMCVQTSKCI